MVVVLSVWLIGCYIATAVQHALPPLPAIVDGVGVHAFSNGAPLAAILGAIGAVSVSMRVSTQQESTIMISSVRQLMAVQILQLCTAALLPAALFAFGAYKYDVLHAIILAGLACTLGQMTLQLKPTFYASTSPPLLLLLKYYVSAALVGLFVVFICGLDAFKGVLMPFIDKKWLAAVGLWQPEIVDMAALTGILVLVSCSLFHCLYIYDLTILII
jgi:hypothetical protein